MSDYFNNIHGKRVVFKVNECEGNGIIIGFNKPNSFEIAINVPITSVQTYIWLKDSQITLKEF